MLRIDIYLSISTIHGIGVFANEFIPKGRVVWDYHPEVDLTFDKNQWNLLKKTVDPKSFREILKYSYKENNKYIICTDGAQFMNHGEINFNLENTKDLCSLFSIRDINKDEELICNYFTYSDADDHHVSTCLKK